MAINAVILAGAPAEPDMQTVGGYSSRAMVQIGDKTMLQWVVDALRSTKSVGQIVAIGDVAGDGLDKVIAPGPGFIENILKGVEAFAADKSLLVVSSDIPLITGEAVDDFIEKAAASGADMCYPIISKNACTAKYPDMKRTYLKTAQGVFTGGNLLVLSPSFLIRNRDRIELAYAARKKPLALAAMIGFGVLLRAILAQIIFPGLLPIPMLEKSVARMLDGNVAAIQTDYPEIGEDVDKASDMAAVQARLAR